MSDMHILYWMGGAIATLVIIGAILFGIAFLVSPKTRVGISGQQSTPPPRPANVVVAKTNSFDPGRERTSPVKFPHLASVQRTAGLPADVVITSDAGDSSE